MCANGKEKSAPAVMIVEIRTGFFRNLNGLMDMNSLVPKDTPKKNIKRVNAREPEIPRLSFAKITTKVVMPENAMLYIVIFKMEATKPGFFIEPETYRAHVDMN